jgi:hypothetical protein
MAEELLTRSSLMEYRDKERSLTINSIPTKVEQFDVSRVESALKRALEVGSDTRVVLTFDNVLAMLRVKSAPTPVALDPKAAYIIVGGVDGLGRSISTWMAERGARHLVFVSRTGGTKPEAMDAIQELHMKGVKTDKVLCSVSDKEALVTAIEEITKRTTVKGVVHAAVVEDVSLVFQVAAVCISTDNARMLHSKTRRTISSSVSSATRYKVPSICTKRRFKPP